MKYLVEATNACAVSGEDNKAAFNWSTGRPWLKE